MSENKIEASQLDDRTRFFIQSDWNESLSAKEPFWISYQKKEYRLVMKSPKELCCLSDQDVFEVVSFSRSTLVLKDLNTSTIHRFVAPSKVYSGIHSKAVTSIDIAPNGLVVSASSDGAMYVWDVIQTDKKLTLKGHLMDVKRCRFFPSYEVVLSVGNDMQMKVWSAIDGQCPVTLRGHKGAINDVQMVDRGRNVISVGSDGLAKLWCVGKNVCIENLFDPTQFTDDCGGLRTGVTGPILCCKLVKWNDVSRLPKRTKAALEDAHGTEDKVLAFGTETGGLVILGVASAQVICNQKLCSAVNCMDFMHCGHNNAILFCGLANGAIHSFNFDGIHLTALSLYTFSTSPVLSICSVSTANESTIQKLEQNSVESNRQAKNVKAAFLAGRQDGTLHFLTECESIQNNQIITYLTGSDCDPINDIVFDGERFIHTACRDGKIRKYSLDNIKFNQ